MTLFYLIENEIMLLSYNFNVNSEINHDTISV